MSGIRFDDRVVIVTGAGRGIGRGYALLLAELGARVVVNDLGGTIGGDGSDVGPAQAVVDEIVAAGGEAIADGSDVSSEDEVQALVAATVDAFGRIDAVVNNAGIVRYAGMPDADLANLTAHLDVHVAGSFLLTRAAWPHLVDSGAGRVVLTASAGMFGLPTNLGYAVAKASMIGMARSMKLAGAADGIKVNVVAPAAMTRMAGPGATDAEDGPMAPAEVAPMVAYLAHETCPVSGEVFFAGAGRFSRLVLATTEGHVQPGATVDDVVANWDAICDASEVHEPADLRSWSTAHLAHLEES